MSTIRTLQKSTASRFLVHATSFKNNGKKHWVWYITASLFTLFQIASSRSRSVLEELVGADFKGFIYFD